MKKRLLSILILFFLISGIKISKAAYFSGPIIPDTNGLRSDTIDILNYTINLNVTDFVTDTLRGNTVIRFAPKMNNIKTLSLDLLHFTVDSVLMSSSHLGFSYNDTLMIITLPTTENIGDTNNVTVFYHGKPVTDPSHVGGFFFQYPYAYNIGQAGSFIPLCFGRCWYPCFDNFRERATYLFNITTDSGKIAFCNGYLAKDTTIGINRTRTWVMNHTLPSYLAGVNVAPYIQVNDTFRGTDTIPIVIATIKSDSSKISGTFAHLKNAISIFQNCFGPYPWNKVGYSETAYNYVAIEDASNITYPNWAFSPAYETDGMAHELAHQWFGDKVTCWAASDMWLNEGFAVYCQNLFQEYLYGDTAYHRIIRTNHENVLQFVYLFDHGFRAISGMNPLYTFGRTTYDKGCDVIGTLRWYMGDSAFFNGLKYYLNSHAYQPVTPDTLKNSLERYSGLNLTDFFNDWVFAPGFAQFSLDSVKSVPSGPNYNVTVYVNQKLDHAPAYYNNVPILVVFKSAAFANYSKTIIVSGNLSSATVTVPFNPAFVGLNLNEGLLDEAIAPDTLLIRDTGSHNCNNAQFYNIKVASVTDSAFVYIEHNFTAPDPLRDTALHYRLSPNHYWKVSGIYPANFKISSVNLYFNGNKSRGGTGYLDTALTIYTRDSVILLYRRNAAFDWREFPGYKIKYLGPATNKEGYLTLDSLPQGEYTFANGVSHVLAVSENKIATKTIDVFPNPTSSSFNVYFPIAGEKEQLFIYDIQGKLMQTVNIEAGKENCLINSSNWQNGVYIISLRNKDKEIGSQQLIIAH